MTKPSLPQGTRDFGPDVVRKRNYILDTIKNVFELYGFQPLETPAMENIETLMGKYGDEGDKLIFKVLNNGPILKNINADDMAEDIIQLLVDEGLISIDENNKVRFNLKTEDAEYTKKIQEIIQPHLREKYFTEKALKYDLTIPFARYVAMNHNTLIFPFKRYQVQPVWRGDRPQRGRYREFYQCDADVVGSKSLLCEVDLIEIINTVLSRLKIDFKIHFNNRKVLSGIAERIGAKERLTDITTALDKIEKIGIDKAMDELRKKGITESVIVELETIIKNLKTKKEGREMVSELRELLSQTKQGIEGIDEIEYVMSFVASRYSIESAFDMKFDIALARGLDYYTGSIIEITAKGVSIGSIGGGGRYDDLTGLFGVPNIPGVGISFGVDRIYDVMEELNLFPADVHMGTQVLFFNLGEKESRKSFELMQDLRQKGVRSELYHETAKFDKQFKYAEKKNIPHIIIIGEKELNEKTCNIKTLATGQQQTIAQQELINYSF